jgi:hypothetical protein
MFDFSDIIRPHLDKYEPHAKGAFLELRAFGHRVLELLTDIRNGLDQDAPSFWRERPTFTLPAGGADSFVVPAGEVWLLEAVTADPTTVGTPGAVSLGITDGLPLFGMNHPGRITTVVGSGIRFESGTAVRVTARENAALVTLQVRIERKPSRKGASGMVDISPDGDEATPNPDPGRHAGNWHPRGVI